MSKRQPRPRTEVAPAADGRAVLTSPPGQRVVIDLWALNDLLHDRRTRRQARRVLLDSRAPIRLPDANN